jgi:hypothetical protein
MELSLPEKVAAFCRGLGDDSFRPLANREGMDLVLRRVELSLRTGQTHPGLESDLDALDAMVMGYDGKGLYPGGIRGYTPLPIPARGDGAQWWSCPIARCAGRGRVLPGQIVPVCAVTGNELVVRPLST